MLVKSRTDIYDYLYNLFYDVVTKNVYSMAEPQELTKSDTLDGFIVIHVGELNDESEFDGQAYGWVRCYVEAFVPPISRGRLDFDLYKIYEDGINDVIERASKDDSDGIYHVEDGTTLSMDAYETTNANNVYLTFIRSFIVNIDKQD